jgi:small-conductance mechanosensitive channel
MSLSFEPFMQSFELVLRGSMTHRVGLGMDARGNITRIDNALSGITDKLERAQEKLAETRKQIEEAKIEAAKPFPQEEELRQKSARLAELDATLNMDVTGGIDEEVSADGQAQEDGGQRSSVLEDLRTKAGQVTACRPARYMEEAL